MQVSDICFALWFLFFPVKSGHKKDLPSQKNLLLVCIKLEFDTRHHPKSETNLGFPLQ